MSHIMKQITMFACLIMLLAGCTTELDRESDQDMQAFSRCRQANPDTWRDKCLDELKRYNTAAEAAKADDDRRLQTVAGVIAVVGAVAADLPDTPGNGPHMHEDHRSDASNAHPRNDDHDDHSTHDNDMGK